MNQPPKIKFCGTTSLDDALAAVDAGADYLGFIFAPSSRQVNRQTVQQITGRIPASVVTVGVFVDTSPDEIQETLKEAGLQVAQLHGNEPPTAARDLAASQVWKAFRIRQETDLDAIPAYAPWVSAIMLDAYSADQAGGTGLSFDWRFAENSGRFGSPIVLAGGLNPENVARAICQVQPDIVDVSSGVEASPGKKDWKKLKAFVDAVKTAGD